ncbi:Myc-type basic helix-loop-helix (bHLH) domain-containing protein [Dioscorea alata]|uniref:Myc-type basic helix-loop-helix (BHLH) domain-containing protein n=1 Tax=Dioscorea alata TaxID=55571 RepID=A0ACB7UP96_DIOAL|nr:Myc-type basic helix-loop-helix (bHLH) domain-containing protein [Dioscorea alata]
MSSFENSNWAFDPSLIGDIPVHVVDFGAGDSGYYWTPQGLNVSPNASLQVDGSQVNSDGPKESSSSKRARSESSGGPSSKACREKMRRDRLNDKFVELGSILDPGKPPRMDKAAILSDAVHMVTQLRTEAQKLKDSNEKLHEKIKELKTEKNELRDEKQRLKSEKESLEQQVKLLNAAPSFVPHPPVIPTPYVAQGQASGQKLMMPVIGYPGFPMWQFMPPADVDTSQDVESCPPVA